METVKRSALLMLWAFALAGIMATPRHIAAQIAAGPPQRFREAVSLATKNSVIKRLEAVRASMVQKQWAHAVELIARISPDDSETLVSISPGRYVNVGRYCNMLLASMPTDGLILYRKKIDPQARQWFEAARRNRDESMMQKVIDRAFVSSYGDDALLFLGEWAWGRGETTTARRCWTQILPLEAERVSGDPFPVLRYPDTDLNRAEILARLVLCSIVEGDARRASRELRAFGLLYADTRGTLAGQSGNLVDILDRVAKQATRWKFQEPEAAVRTFAGNAKRNGNLPLAVDVGSVQWSVRLPKVALRRPPRRRRALKEPGALSYHPVTFGDVLLLNDAERIFAWNLATGKPAWPGGDDNSAIIFPSLPEQHAPISRRPALGIPHYTMTVQEGRLYAKMGSPITGPWPKEVPLPSDLVCLGLAEGEGKLLWKTSAGDIAADWSFEGSPVVDGGRVYIALRRRRPQTQINVACYNSETGRLIWNRKVCAAVADLGADYNIVSHQLLTMSDNTLFCATGMGAVAALDARDGLLKWVVTYEQRLKPNASRTIGSQNHGTLTPCLFHRGIVVAAPNDFAGVMAIDAGSGIVMWKRRLRGGVRHLLGVGKEGTLIVSGQRLWGLRIRTGEVVWKIGSSVPATAGYGRGLLADHLVYWPKRDEIFVVHQRTGSIRRRIALHKLHHETGGNLMIAHRMLFVAGPRRLVAFSEYGSSKKRSGDDISFRSELFKNRR